jgi:hypothetical protein
MSTTVSEFSLNKDTILPDIRARGFCLRDSQVFIESLAVSKRLWYLTFKATG